MEEIGMVEDYQQAISLANIGGIRDTHGLHSNLGLKNCPQRWMCNWELEKRDVKFNKSEPSFAALNKALSFDR
ncbi:hypothetical protein L6452_36388 [Arctium lappa]|uniref:Uncharacterized protein n=1 Tax=Arctium lappa TaxID=4217 RepID=A0ACB8Y938_ARCLA|nr:hypothetical protein L6452_36388 [Arctium lappa]